LDDVRAVQPLPAQDRAPLTTVGRVVLSQDRRLELSGEPTPLRLVSTRGHTPIIGADISSRHRHLSIGPISPRAVRTSAVLVSRPIRTHRGPTRVSSGACRALAAASRSDDAVKSTCHTTQRRATGSCALPLLCSTDRVSLVEVTG